MSIYLSRKYITTSLNSIFQTNKNNKKTNKKMEPSNTQISIETLINKITNNEKRLNIFQLRLNAEIENSLALYSEVKVEMRKHLSCSVANQGNSRNFTLMNHSKVLETLLKSSNYAIIKDISNSSNSQVTLCSCDGGVRNLHSVMYSVAAFSFGESSNLFGCTNVRQSVNSTHSEIKAIYLLLTQAITNNINRILAIIDNVPALNIAALALKTNIFDSLELQDFIKNNPEAEITLNLLYDLANSFQFIGMIWQKSHVPDDVGDKIVHLNHHSDMLATNQLDEILESLRSNAI